MSLYAIGDLHLSFSANKPMEIFGGNWEGYINKLRSSFSALSEDDVTVLCGDLSWAMSLNEAEADFSFINSFPGKKIILKGNHDYWWTTAAKMSAFFIKNNFKNIDILHNSCFFYEDFAICGTRGWFIEEDEGGHNQKVFNRELCRLEASFKAAGDKEILCFLHYPPKYHGYVCGEIIDLMKRYKVSRCLYGHLHGPSHRLVREGFDDGIVYSLVSADYLDFIPLKIL